MSDKLKIKGFSHLHQSGTGAIDYYYNYGIISPFYGKLQNAFIPRDVKSEYAKPGMYSAELEDITGFVTVSGKAAFHKYVFKKNGGRAAVDFSNDGLEKSFGEQFYSYAKDCAVLVKEKDTVLFSGILSGVRLYFCVKAYGENIRTSLFYDNSETSDSVIKPEDTTKNFGAVFDFDSDEIMFKVGYSLKSFDEAENDVDSLNNSFEQTAQDAYDEWNKYLSAVKIESEDRELKTKFYSCLYHSLIKPCVIDNDLTTDYGTFWDQYKTLYPLIFMLYREGRNVADGIVSMSRKFGKIPCSLGLTDMFPCEKQAKMLGIIALCDAYYMGIANIKEIEECIIRELDREDFKEFLSTGYFERYTHILDVADACGYVMKITENDELKKRLSVVADYWKNAYDNDGLMSKNSSYYEGDRYTYSFRLQCNIDDRIALAGGKEKYAEMLDSFFGFGKKSVKQITTTIKPYIIIGSKHYHRFEGFNNECDMETPFSYIFADRYDRLCEIINGGVRDSFRLGKGGLPGNNDSGGLSSLLVWLVLGIFPWAGSGKFLLGCPQTKKAELCLNNGNKLTIISDIPCGVAKEIFFNGKKIENYIINTADLMQGGELVFMGKEKEI